MQACRYSVRDAGFVQLNEHDFQLCFVGSPSAFPKSSLDALRGLLAESNVAPAFFDPAADSEMLRSSPLGAAPGWRLVSGTGDALSLDGLKSAGPDEAARATLSSPRRDALLIELPKVFAVVLLADGMDAAENERCEKAIRAAIAALAAEFPAMPKPVKQIGRAHV